MIEQHSIMKSRIDLFIQLARRVKWTMIVIDLQNIAVLEVKWVGQIDYLFRFGKGVDLVEELRAVDLLNFMVGHRQKNFHILIFKVEEG